MTVTVYRDVVSSRLPGYRPLSLDLYVPAGPARALCLYLHGGWRLGSRTDGPGTSQDWTPSFFERVAGMGLAIASVDYRLSGEATRPGSANVLAATMPPGRQTRAASRRASRGPPANWNAFTPVTARTTVGER
jgi:acetyl esterase/lipase